MTISSTTNRVTYPGTGDVGPFTFPFRVFTSSDLLVIQRDADGIETQLLEGTHYTVSGAGNASGSIALVTALPVGESLSIRRAPSLVQPTSIQNNGSYFAKTHEDEFDRLVMQLQDLADRADRSVGILKSFDPASYSLRVKPETGKALVWQSDTELGNASLDTLGDVALPGEGRTVATLTAYLLNNAVANVKDFGAVGDGIADDTAAIELAIATGKSIYFPAGIYSTTGGHTLGKGSDPRAIGQSLFGAGRYGSPTGIHLSSGTKIIRRSGTTTLFTLGQTDQNFQDVLLDGNNLGGTLLRLKGTKYSTISRVGFKKVGGTSYAMLLDDASVVNLCNFYDLHFDDTNYGHIDIDNALYSNFWGCQLGQTSSGAAGIDIGAVGGQASMIQFFGCFTDAKISIHDVASSINFYGLCSETVDEVLVASGANVQGILVAGYRSSRNATANPLFSFTSCKHVTLRDLHIRDISGAGVDLIALAGVNRFAVDGADVYVDNAMDFIECTGTRSDQVAIRNVYCHSGVTANLKAKCAQLLIENCLLAVTFVAGNNDATLMNGSGTVNTANASEIVLLHYKGAVTDAGGIARHVLPNPTQPQALPAYGVAVAIDASAAERQIIAATNGVAFAIGAPSSALPGRRLTITIKNTSGGALGAITWNAAFHLAGAFTAPATGNNRSVTFEYDGTSGAWLEVGRTAADVAN